MRLLASIIFCFTLASFVWGWQQSETEEYSDASLPSLARMWKEANTDKRNTWWTKKSVQEDLMANGCHLGGCMMMFKECLRQAENRSLYMQCKESQFTCMATCLREHRERVLVNNPPMSS